MVQWTQGPDSSPPFTAQPRNAVIPWGANRYLTAGVGTISGEQQLNYHAYIFTTNGTSITGYGPDTQVDQINDTSGLDNAGILPARTSDAHGIAMYGYANNALSPINTSPSTYWFYFYVPFSVSGTSVSPGTPVFLMSQQQNPNGPSTTPPHYDVRLRSVVSNYPNGALGLLRFWQQNGSDVSDQIVDYYYQFDSTGTLVSTLSINEQILAINSGFLTPIDSRYTLHMFWADNVVDDPNFTISFRIYDNVARGVGADYVWGPNPALNIPTTGSVYYDFMRISPLHTGQLLLTWPNLPYGYVITTSGTNIVSINKYWHIAAAGVGGLNGVIWLSGNTYIVCYNSNQQDRGARIISLTTFDGTTWDPDPNSVYNPGIPGGLLSTDYPQHLDVNNTSTSALLIGGTGSNDAYDILYEVQQAGWSVGGHGYQMAYGVNTI